MVVSVLWLNKLEMPAEDNTFGALALLLALDFKFVSE
jgi:hypothetical protein